MPKWLISTDGSKTWAKPKAWHDWSCSIREKHFQWKKYNSKRSIKGKTHTQQSNIIIYILGTGLIYWEVDEKIDIKYHLMFSSFHLKSNLSLQRLLSLFNTIMGWTELLSV